KLDDGINCMKTVGDLLNWVDKGEWDRIDMDREQLPERLDESEALSEICEAIKGLASLRQDVLALEAQFETSFKAFNVQDTKDRIKDLRKELGEKTGNLHAALPAMSEEMWQPIHSEISESLDRKSEWADKLRSAKTLFEQWQPSPIEDATDTKLLQDLVTQWGNLKGDVDKAKVFKKTLFEQWQPSPIEDATDTKLLQDLVTQWGKLKGDVDKAKVFKDAYEEIEKTLNRFAVRMIGKSILMDEYTRETAENIERAIKSVRLIDTNKYGQVLQDLEEKLKTVKQGIRARCKVLVDEYKARTHYGVSPMQNDDLSAARKAVQTIKDIALDEGDDNYLPWAQKTMEELEKRDKRR
ncbi:MAG: hypothetical protein J7M08_00805, partial [Planctomycetes bacterium]|nr:hypothetical protein [Planctomycetota bacterium]